MMHPHARYLALGFSLTPAFLFAISVTVSTTPSTCGNNNGSAYASAVVGLPPYAFSCSNDGTIADIGGLAPSSYTVTARLVDGHQLSGILLKQ
jgi:hypothetical protein